MTAKGLTESALAAAPALLLVVDGKGMISACHGAGLSVLGLDAKALLGAPAQQILDHHVASDSAGLREFLAALDRQAGTIRLERNGHAFDVRVAGLPEGGAVCIGLDVTDSVNAEKEMRMASAVFETTSEAIMVTDSANRVILVNPAFCKITGWGESDILGKDPGVLNSGRQDAAFFKEMWEALQAGNHWEGEIHNRRKDGEVFPAWMSITMVRDDQGKPVQYVAMFSDITKRKLDEQRILYQANYDALTGLPNRFLVQERLRETVARAETLEQQVGVLYLDLDHFKFINDSRGHGAGDQLLVEVTERLRRCLGKSDTLGRLGGDEFMAILPDSDPDEVVLAARQMQEAVSRPMSIGDESHEIVVTMSIGIAMYPSDGKDTEDLVRSADTAAFHAKSRGRNCHQFFTQTMNAEVQERVELENKLRRALERGEFLLHYQPKVDLRSGRIVGAEALVRWQLPDEGVIAPYRFIPLAEETGLIVPLGEWVLKTACIQAKAWQKAGLPRIQMAVNLSVRQLAVDGLVDRVRAILDETELSPQCLELEITESFIMETAERTLEILRRLRNLGIRLSVDDFGTGYSSLSYLKSFPVDTLKIDRAFVNDIGGTDGGAMLAGAIVGIGQSLNLRVVAEGVETEEQLAYLRQLWCDEMQGYLFSPPVPAEAFEAMLREGRKL